MAALAVEEIPGLAGGATSCAGLAKFSGLIRVVTLGAGLQAAVGCSKEIVSQCAAILLCAIG